MTHRPVARTIASMDDVTIWHNTSCSKSRGALDLLRERGIEPTVFDYVARPPSEAELREMLTRLGLGPRDLVRKGEEAYARLGLDDPGLSDDELIAAMVAEPILIERPIVLVGDRAVVGRPPERVLDLL